MPRKGFRPPRSKNGPTGRDNSDQWMKHFREIEDEPWIDQKTRENQRRWLEGSRNDDLPKGALRWGEGVNVAWTAPFRWNTGQGLAYEPPELPNW